MPSAGQIIGLLAIVAYLSAAFHPCERTGEAFLPAPSVLETHGTPVAAETTHSAPHSSHHASHKNHDTHNTSEAQGSHHKVATESSVVWMPTCLCGCSDSRAQIGGGAARLGPVVPAAFAAQLLPRTILSAVKVSPRPILAPDDLIDPIPT